MTKVKLNIHITKKENVAGKNTFKLAIYANLMPVKPERYKCNCAYTRA